MWPTCAARPVAAMMQRRTEGARWFHTTGPPPYASCAGDYSALKPTNMVKTGLQYLLFGTGLATSQGLETGAFIKSRPDLEHPDLQYHFIATLMFDHTRRKADRHGFMAHVCQLRPQSRGFISIKSTDPKVAPLIQPNYLEAEEDRRALREANRMKEKFVELAQDHARQMLKEFERKEEAELEEVAEMGSARRRAGEEASA